MDEEEEQEGEEEEEMMLNDEQYQLLMQMQNHQNMLIDQQEGEFPQNLNEEQIRQLQEMYGQEEYDGEEEG